MEAFGISVQALRDEYKYGSPLPSEPIILPSHPKQYFITLCSPKKERNKDIITIMAHVNSRVQEFLNNNRKFAETYTSPPTMDQIRAGSRQAGAVLICLFPIPINHLKGTLMFSFLSTLTRLSISDLSRPALRSRTVFRPWDQHWCHS